MILSVVVCTLNRCTSLKRCVDALLSVSTPHDWQLVIVDNGSTDGTGEYLASLAQRQSNRPMVTTAFEPKRGLAAARNTGWRTARAGIVSFTDDDCYVSKDYVDSVIQVFEEEPGIGFLTGRILLFDTRDCRITIQESQDRCEFRPGTFIAAGAVQGANLAFQRKVLEQVGGFDERLGAGTPYPSEDIDAAAAALWAGFFGVYDPRPLVYHDHGRRTAGEVLELMRGYDAGRGAYYAKYILGRASRGQYLGAWLKSMRSEFTGALRRGHFPTMAQSRRELTSGLRFLMQRSN